MQYLKFGKEGEKIPLVGQGTAGIEPSLSSQMLDNWKMVLKKGIELGMTHIDTAELYGNGLAEEIVGDVIKDHDRNDLFITTKMLPSRITEKAMRSAIEGSLKRLKLKYVDLYLIHWLEEDSSIEKIMRFLEKMVDEGKTRYIGVSNFSLDEVKAARKVLKKNDIITNQIRLNVRENLHMLECLPYYQDENLFITAYSPLDDNGLQSIEPSIQELLKRLAEKYEKTIQQVAIAWLINHDNVIAIPKTTSVKHVVENAEAVDIKLTWEELKAFEYKMIDSF